MGEPSLQSKLNNFFGQFPLVKFKKNEIIVRADANPEGIYFISEGFIRQFIISEDGTELTIHFFKPGSFFPLFWAINDLANRYYYQAFTKSEIRVTPKDRLLEFIKNDLDILYMLTKRLLFGLEGLVTRVESLASRDARARTIGIILFLGKHFGTKDGDKLTITQPFTHEDLSKLTALTRETTSRELEILIRQGLIDVENHRIYVPDITKLV